jgi:hypothetical protein
MILYALNSELHSTHVILAHFAYFVPLLKLADFVKAGADVSFLTIYPTKEPRIYG